MQDIAGLPESPQRKALYAAEALDELLQGTQRLREAFFATPTRFAPRHATIMTAGQSEPAAVLLRDGFAFRAADLPDGRRAILDILIPGDVTGVDNVLLARPVEALIASSRLVYHMLGAAELRDLLADRAVSLRALSLLAEARWRSDRLAASIGRLDAEARICVMLLDIHDRLQRCGLLTEPAFSLPLTQQKVADHLGLTLVHVNRTFRRLRDEGVVAIERHVVRIRRLDLLRERAQGLPEPAALSEPIARELRSRAD